MGTRKRKRIKKKLIAAILPVLLICIWQWLGKRGAINQSILPIPSEIIKTFGKMIEDGSLKKHLIISVVRVLEGFLLGGGLGVILGIIIGLFRTAEDIMSALVGILRPIPPIACVPILILWLGIAEGSKIAVIAIGSFWPVLLNTIHGIKSADTKLLEVAKTFEKNKMQILWHIVLPSSLPAIFTGVRLGISAAWTCVVTAEMIAASKGVGFLISYARELSQPDVLLVGIASIGLIGLLIDTLVLRLQEKLLYWSFGLKE
ncbi:ABC transporter permease [Anaerosporobacter sp.]